MAQIVIVDPDAAGLDAMIGGLLQAAIQDPAKAALVDAMKGTVTIAAPDADVEIGLSFGNGVCRVHSTGLPGSTISISMPAELLLGLSTIPLKFGMPSVMDPAGRAFHKQVLTGKVKIGGLHHVKLMSQLNTLLSVL